MKLEFEKYEGAGNDFVIIDNRDRSIELTKQQVSFLCNRHFGIGADGLMLLEPSGKSDFKMVYFNSDGNESTMCGNGGRCIVKFAQKQGVVAASRTSFEAIDGLHHAEFLDGNLVKLGMNNVSAIERSKEAYFLDTGSPHWVEFVEEDVNQMDLLKRAKAIRYNARFKAEGTNVNYAQVSGASLVMRTYERGVENETLACGAGATATAIAAHAHGVLSQNSIALRTPGGELQVSFDYDGKVYSNVFLTGEATFVFKGEIVLK